MQTSYPLAIILLATGFDRTMEAQNYFVRFTPMVILNDGVSSTRLEVKVTTGATVYLQVPANTPIIIQGASGCQGAMNVQLRDDGTYGDQAAGDGVDTLDDIRFDLNRPPSCCVGYYTTPAPSIWQGLGQLSFGDITINLPTGSSRINYYEYTLFFMASQFGSAQESDGLRL